MSALLDVILPVFLIIGLGYAAARFGGVTAAGVDGIMSYAQSFALPILLFKSIAAIDLGQAYSAGLMLSFYIGAFASFALCFGAARLVFHRPAPDAVAMGFAGYFSNSVLLGLPITQNAYGAGALAGNFAIISIHAPTLYALGILAMVLAQANPSQSAAALARQTLTTILRQPLVIGIICGFAVNLSGLNLPAMATTAVGFMAASAIPAALFGLGGVLLRYRPEGEAGLIATVTFASLVLHPAIAYSLGRYVFDLDTAALRSATLCAAMAPGVNAYVFANLFGLGRRVAASSVLIATALSILTIWIWLHILP
jgi:malonate transporter